jgi:hypothetical protein
VKIDDVDDEDEDILLGVDGRNEDEKDTPDPEDFEDFDALAILRRKWRVSGEYPMAVAEDFNEDGMYIGDEFDPRGEEGPAGGQFYPPFWLEGHGDKDHDDEDYDDKEKEE